MERIGEVEQQWNALHMDSMIIGRSPKNVLHRAAIHIYDAMRSGPDYEFLTPSEFEYKQRAYITGNLLKRSHRFDAMDIINGLIFELSIAA